MTKERVNFDVDQTQKREWQEYADSEYGGNLSQLIRRAVSKEINSGHVTPQTGTGVEEVRHDDFQDRVSRLTEFDAGAGESIHL